MSHVCLKDKSMRRADTRPTELNCKFMNKAGISYVSLNHEWMSRDNVIAKSQNNKCTREAAISSVKWNKSQSKGKRGAFIAFMMGISISLISLSSEWMMEADISTMSQNN
ncbi:hypothetical protein Y1Q_0005896 [Alligator mississippiensis]|uniref:Uncharacterized protein n=1 Tax=Alligator mississippiensis TaxID=8496 RepID=A0A151M7E0_ALLMI|nr:hypothetical protein Y1Q_0005896 [Alligator mississippiensis]